MPRFQGESSPYYCDRCLVNIIPNTDIPRNTDKPYERFEDIPITSFKQWQGICCNCRDACRYEEERARFKENLTKKYNKHEEDRAPFEELLLKEHENQINAIGLKLLEKSIKTLSARKLITDTGADLYTYPTPIDTSKLALVSLGDLHGNWLKLIYFLIKINVAYITNDRYQKLVKYYTSKTINAHEKLRNIEEIENILDCIQFISVNFTVLFIGDVLCDRGMSDYLTLYIFFLLERYNVPIVITYSNHDNYAFLGIKSTTKGQIESVKRFCNYNGQGQSFEFHTREELEYTKYYFKHPHYKYLMTRYAEKLTPYYIHENIIFTHAPLDPITLKDLIKQQKLYPQRRSKFHTMLKSMDNFEMLFDQTFDQKDLLLAKCCGVATMTSKNDEKTIEIGRIAYQLEQNYFSESKCTINVFGHVGENYPENRSFQVNLDTWIGRSDCPHQGKLRIYAVYKAGSFIPHQRG